MRGTYEFECKKCKQRYDDFCEFDPTGKYPEVKCPDCGSKAKSKLISVPRIGGPTKSKRENFEYRAKENMENAKDLRRRAEAASHMGQSNEIFNAIDDMPEYEGKIV